MNDMLNILQKRHNEYCEEREAVIKELTPLENRKKKLDEKIEAIENLMSLEGDVKPAKENEQKNEKETKLIGGPLAGKTGQEAYKQLIETDFKNRKFKDPEIRKIATEKGLRINDKPISGSYSRAIIGRLIDQGDLKRIGKGVFSTSDD